MRKMTKRCLERMIQVKGKKKHSISYQKGRKRKKSLQKWNCHYVGAECVRFKWKNDENFPWKSVQHEAKFQYICLYGIGQRGEITSTLCFYNFSTENLCFLESWCLEVGKQIYMYLDSRVEMMEKWRKTLFGGGEEK